jgi:hypothetical protein
VHLPIVQAYLNSNQRTVQQRHRVGREFWLVTIKMNDTSIHKSFRLFTATGEQASDMYRAMADDNNSEQYTLLLRLQLLVLTAPAISSAKV